ncbi:arsenate reductase (glutaredoxin) [Sansalvadorimonas verongulae]|uniref:arsenate reductase (glutaredoxin) n=1 Tax=Sansalvadorimonas verongulae TaxID=2172824 RepID=UPI0012BC4C26|nr:arsenate reductase (glutaredoxin) [Sansalvadorimonas verongulae]MTI14773.1 arsenate reductase (glutaredoxin) [Sansalvadorimonas verongulae]
MAAVTIYHNPRCSKSRQTLQLLQENGVEPEVVLYLEDTPPLETLARIIVMLGVSVREFMRTGESAYKDNNLKDSSLSDRQLLEAMVEHPKLIQRPVVLANGQARIGRPPESVLEIL